MYCIAGLSLIMCACSASGRHTNALPDAELKLLDDMLANSQEYDSRRASVIDSLDKRFRATPVSDMRQRMSLLLSMADRYRSFCSDSSLIFYMRAYDIGHQIDPSDQLIDVRIKMLNAQAASGLFGVAEKQLAYLDSLSLTPRQLLDKAAAARQLYSYFKGYLGEENALTPAITAKFLKYDAYLREHLSDNDPYRKFLVGEQHVRDGKNKEALKQLDALLHALPSTDNLYGKAAYQCAQASRNLGNDLDYGRYLALSAMSDVEGSVKETLALPALAQWLYDKGEVDRAYHYINSSLHDATASNSRMRTVAIANFVPIIDNSYRHKISASRDELMVYFLLVVILLISSGALLFIFLRNLCHSNNIRKKLQAQTKMQENYIGHFLGLCASYADKLEANRKLVQRKITAGQADELLKIMKSSRAYDDQADDFFKVFDETFLDLYPDFIDKFNALLRPEEQIPYVKGAPLSTELRIYAFVRLGVHESVRIAQILRCSVSTIYTYRNRMRGRAINRETFEADVEILGNAD